MYTKEIINLIVHLHSLYVRYYVNVVCVLMTFRLL